jgi:hypothetical protein
MQTGKQVGALVVAVALQMEIYKCAPEGLKIMNVSKNYRK